jgi:hypothetical protein
VTRLSAPPGRSGEPVLTVRQPWATAILRAGKDIENRTWTTGYRGRLWIHAGVARSRREADEWAEARRLALPDEPLPRGAIMGHVTFVDIVVDPESPWALPEHYHWALRRPVLLERPVEWKGRLGLTFIRPPRGSVRHS